MNDEIRRCEYERRIPLVARCDESKTSRRREPTRKCDEHERRLRRVTRQASHDDVPWYTTADETSNGDEPLRRAYEGHDEPKLSAQRRAMPESGCTTRQRDGEPRRATRATATRSRDEPWGHEERQSHDVVQPRENHGEQESRDEAQPRRARALAKATTAKTTQGISRLPTNTRMQRCSAPRAP